MLFNLFSANRRRPVPPSWTLSHPLLEWSPGVPWTLREACEGLLVLGGTGSGKTSGSGRKAALAMLRAGFGGLVCTVKPEEAGLWEAYCRETGRIGDLIVFSPGNDWRFNFLDYESSKAGVDAGVTENIVQLLCTVLESGERSAAQGGGGREDEGFWRRAVKQLIRNGIEALTMATGRVSVPELYRLLVSAPNSLEQVRSEGWQAESFCFACLRRAEKRVAQSPQRQDLEIIADYFLLEWPALSEKTRSVVLSTFTSMVDVLNRGALRQLLCTETNVSPDAVEHGKIVVLDLPVKTYAEVGLYAQSIWKYCFQRSIERRDTRTSPRPVFLWADEAQYFITSRDMQFQTTCRSSKVATVLLSQNVPNFYAALGGGDKGRCEADSLFGNLNTKLLHANLDAVTNEWASRLIGRSRQIFCNGNSSGNDDWASVALGLAAPTQSSGFSESYEFELQPAVFTQLRTGGPANRRVIDAILVQNGKLFADTGGIWRPVQFAQQA